MISVGNSQGMNDGFSLIWYYWFKKYMTKKGKKNQSPQQLINLKKKYHIEAIESSSSTNSSIQQKLDAISDKSHQSVHQPSQAIGIYTINPAAEAHQIQELLLRTDDPQETKDLINQLYSYYLNSNNVYIIYRQQKEDLVMEPISKIINEDDSLGERNDSIVESFEKLENKIEHLELLDRLTQFDGVEIWNAKYLGIPHSFVKTKKFSWARALNRPISHPSQPRTISDLPIIPRITPLRPSFEKLMPFISYMKMVEQKTPGTNSVPMPTIESIFQYNGLPYIFAQDYKQQSIGVLCYYIVFGNQQGMITQNMVQRWMEDNPSSNLTKVIKQMQERYRNRNRYSKDGVSRGLGLLTGQDAHGNQIW